MLARKALAGTAGTPKVYVEDVFQSWLYVGTGATQTITNGVDISGKGGLVWIKNRDQATSHCLQDSERGSTKTLQSNTTNAEATKSTGITSFGSTGFTIGDDGDFNENTKKFVSWTFRKAKKFFDVVTYTGNGTAGRTISHNLGSVPGCIIVKNLTTAGTGWIVYHRSLGNTKILELNTTAAEQTQNEWNNTDPTSTVFSVYSGYGTNYNGNSYVAYLFAHDAGGFGDAGSDNVISCGSFTSSGSGGATVTLNYEAQWVLLKNTSAAENWILVDTMRGMSFSATPFLKPNLSDAEGSLGAGAIVPTATGFTVANGVLSNSNTYIYIAIRRGPMKTPTSGTSVYEPITYTGNASARTLTSGFPVDTEIVYSRAGGQGWEQAFFDRMRGNGRYLASSLTDAEVNVSGDMLEQFQSMTGVKRYNFYFNSNSASLLTHCFRRAPGFFDVVCWTGTSGGSKNHNLGKTPELIIQKRRNSAATWYVWSPATTGLGKYGSLETNDAFSNTDATANSTTFQVLEDGTGNTFVAYLFASLSGISKVGSYTGNGSSVTVTTDFQPRFILVKRTDSTGDWLVSDSARGLVAGNDPYLKLNSTAAEVTNEDWVDISSTSFTVNQTTNNANVNTGTYIYLAIA